MRGDDNFDNRDRDLVRLPCRDHPRRHLARDEPPERRDASLRNSVLPYFSVPKN